MNAKLLSKIDKSIEEYTLKDEKLMRQVLEVMQLEWNKGMFLCESTSKYKKAMDKLEARLS